MAMEYAASLKTLKMGHPALAEEVAPFNTLENVLAWMSQRGLPLGSLEIVAQDEFSHDVLIPLEPKGPWLVFGST
jgi:hypothetical protein